MRIEAFTAAKDPARPGANEDCLVVLPGRLYAVLDGVSARSPALYDGMLSGQFASTLVQGLLERGPRWDGRTVIGAMTEALADANARFGLDRAAPGLRLATTMALVLQDGDGIEIILVGDSGVRIDGGPVNQMTKVLDGITAALRTAAWHRAGALTSDPVIRERLSRAVSFHGIDHAEGWPTSELEAVGRAAAAACAALFPEISTAAIAELLHGGIINAQGRHQNDPGSPLGYGCLDGTAVPERFIGRLTLRSPRQIELFTDGYFAPGYGFGIAAWEDRFAEVEREDPAKIGRYASVKGSVGGSWSDDRTYVGVEVGHGSGIDAG